MMKIKLIVHLLLAGHKLWKFKCYGIQVWACLECDKKFEKQIREAARVLETFGTFVTKHVIWK